MRVCITLQLVAPLLAILIASDAVAGQPITGRPVPELEEFDDLMSTFMDANGIEAGVLGVMRNGQIVYLRGFGYLDTNVPMPENALVRLASVTKPITAAATRVLIAQGAFDVDSFAFDLGQVEGGLLDLDPFPSLGDDRLADVTVDHLLRHRGGWDRDEVGDVTYMELAIAADMDIDSPPGRENTVRWILGQPLQFTPGSDAVYSNVGSLTLGLIIEQASGDDLLSFVRENVLTAEMWVPETEIRLGRTFREWGHQREPWYRTPLITLNVFFSFGPPLVSPPYGGWDHEARIGQGAMVASAPTMLRLAQAYHIGFGTGSSVIGQPIDDANPLTHAETHNGSLLGTNTQLWQRTDGVNAFVFFNSAPLDGHYGTMFAEQLDELLDGGTLEWPQTTSDGFWASPENVAPSGDGSFDEPFLGVGHALASTASGSRIRLTPGTSNWTGTITERTELDAPLGPATIGQ